MSQFYCFSDTETDQNDLTWIVLSEDGVPESKMSSKSINVLTVRLINCALVVPLAIVKSYNETKVDVDVVWKPLIKQINQMKHIRVHHMCFDAVKRKEILGMKGHGGYYSCPYCHIKGTYLGGKVVFTYNDSVKATLRTDKEIREIMERIDQIEIVQRRGAGYNTNRLENRGI